MNQNQFLCPQATMEADNKDEALSFSAVNLEETVIPGESLPVLHWEEQTHKL